MKIVGLVGAGLLMAFVLSALGALPLAFLATLVLGAIFSPGPSFAVTFGVTWLGIMVLSTVRSIFKK